MRQTTVLEKAKRIATNEKVKIKKNTDKHIHFEVVGDTDVYSVIYDKKNDFWKCSCKWGSIKKGECSHILSAKLLFKGNGMWKPNLDFVPIYGHRGKGKLLWWVKELLDRSDIEITNVLKDDYGAFCFDTPIGLICCKQYVYGNVVSCNWRILASSLHQNKPIIMYLSSSDAFYKFPPEKVLKVGEDNYRGSCRMINFPISLGERINLKRR